METTTEKELPIVSVEKKLTWMENTLSDNKGCFIKEQTGHMYFTKDEMNVLKKAFDLYKGITKAQ